MTQRARRIPGDVTGPAPELNWPSSISRPVRSPVLVYLDLNHWINLSKANIGHSDGSNYVPLLDACRRAKVRGVARFVLSLTLHQELGSRVTNPRQRHNAAAVMEELTEHEVILSRTILMRHELEAALNTVIGTPAEPLEDVDVVVRGILQASGLPRSFTITNTETKEDGSGLLRDHMGAAAYDKFVEDALNDLDHAMLYGPTDDELPAISKHGYAPGKGLRRC